MVNPLTDPKGASAEQQSGGDAASARTSSLEGIQSRIDPSGKGTHGQDDYGQGDKGAKPPQEQDTAEVQQGLGSQTGTDGGESGS